MLCCIQKKGKKNNMNVKYSVRHIDGDHVNGNARLENNACRFRVNLDGEKKNSKSKKKYK